MKKKKTVYMTSLGLLSLLTCLLTACQFLPSTEEAPNASVYQLLQGTWKSERSDSMFDNMTIKGQEILFQYDDRKMKFELSDEPDDDGSYFVLVTAAPSSPGLFHLKVVDDTHIEVFIRYPEGEQQDSLEKQGGQ